MDEATLRTYRSYHHPVLAVLLPFLFGWVVVSYLAAIAPSLTRLTPLYPVLLLLAPMSEAVVGNYLASRRSGGILPRLRESIVLLLFSYLFLKVVDGDAFRGDWGLARLDLVVGLALVPVVWALALSLHTGLRERELLLALLTGGGPGGTREVFRSLGIEAGTTLAAMRRIRNLVVALQAVAFLALFFVSLAVPERLAVGTLVLTVLHFSMGLAAVSAINGYVAAQEILGAGLSASPGFLRRRTVYAVAVALAGCLLLVPLIGPEAPLPSSYLRDFIAWLQRVLTLPAVGAFPPADAPAPRDPSAVSEMPPLRDFADLEPGNESLQRLFRILILILVVGGPSVALLVALVAPLFRRPQTPPHPLRALRTWLARLGRTLAGVARWALGTGGLRIGPGERRGPLWLLGSGGTSREGRRAGLLVRLGQSREVRTFVRVIRWGERRGVRFRRFEGPREYARVLGERVPAVGAELERMAEILEEHLFSNHVPQERRSLEYFAAARHVLRGG